MSVLRAAIAVVAGVMLLNVMDAILGDILVRAVADAPPVDQASYLAVRNRPGVLAATVVTHGFAATLAGYILARIAGAHEVRLAVAAAALLTASYAYLFATGGVPLPPVWARVATLIITPPALIAGAYIRAEARVIQSEQQAGDARPEERP